MPVRPSSAALAKRARGKWPDSSSSLARGRTADSANSRTVLWRRDCSSVRSRFMGGNSLAQKKEKHLHRERGGHRGHREKQIPRFARNDNVGRRMPPAEDGHGVPCPYRL